MPSAVQHHTVVTEYVVKEGALGHFQGLKRLNRLNSETNERLELGQYCDSIVRVPTNGNGKMKQNMDNWSPYTPPLDQML